jgi:hypothetical protein
MNHQTKKSKSRKPRNRFILTKQSAKISKHPKKIMDINNNEKKDMHYLNQFHQILMQLFYNIAIIYNYRKELI